MHITRLGTGVPPVFFVHGLACDGTDWRAQVETLSARTTVVTCDLPGHGLSPGTPAECTIEAYGIAVADALASLEVAPAIVVGHSMGCRVVLAASRARPDAVAGLVLVDGSRIGAGDPDAAGQSMADELVGDGYLRFMRSFFESMFVPSSDPLVRQTIIDRALRFPAVLGRPLLTDLARWDAGEVEAVLDAVDVPLLAIQSTTMDTARERVSLSPGVMSVWLDLVGIHVPHARSAILPGTSHFPQIERADEVTMLIADFVAANETHTDP
ncbi:alpha/beta fold hydrolase [Mycobacterium sp. IDR2000157661]|uniref:alpha/beta fold hydrolase n=1 Tax=Mycobacterium sp. IDR2000157661 TaxID=2867005 RepID=UPI001EEBBB86|nr:alpha/beta fold hydrolase [Mycobacterium sp. IDR2000157661]ULE31338.1 alpha/beta fold hydrolase [Mycobacterium sp. IDR2000157661]